MSGIRVVPGQCNAKHHWPNAARRMAGMIGVANLRNITFMSLNEMSDVQFNQVKKHHPKWDILQAPPNEEGKWGWSGNAVAYRTDVWDLRRFNYISVKTSSNTLNMPFMKLHHRRADVAVAMLAIHNPTEKNARGNDREKCVAAELHWFDQILEGQEYEPFISGDSNDATPFPSLKKLAQDGPDVIQVRREIKVSKERVYHVKGTLSDHNIISGTATLGNPRAQPLKLR